ncbi:MAG: hypothetical protein JW932_15425 [Deltaproteobacteria bacterium]|nr:hypothetical protein [Deltaproteobacteria bacterium]
MTRTKIFVFSFVILLTGFVVACSNLDHQTAKRPGNPGNIQTKETSILHDPTEGDPRYKEIFETIDDEVNEILKDHPMRGKMGFCHIFWETKEEILKKKYGIVWKSPAEMNPHIIFD